VKKLNPDQFNALSAEVSGGVGAFIGNLLMQGDRAAVVLGAARLDVALEAALRCLMSTHPNGQDNLFDPDRPLGTLSAKIALAHRLGVIDQDVEQALQIIRKIRNDFAHSIDDESLSVQRHRDRLRSSTSRAKETESWNRMAAEFENLGVSETLKEFAMLLMIIIVNLEVFARLEERVTVVGLVRFNAEAG
jgi:hypothetical protein